MLARLLKRACHSLRVLRKGKRGNGVVLTAAAMPVLIGGAGLGVDVTQWYLWQRELQMSVDAAALAGAYSKVQGKSYDASARTTLADNKQVVAIRSEERRVGKESGSTCRSRESPHSKKKKNMK